MVHYVIDAYNLIFKGFLKGTPTPESLQIARTRLIQELVNFKGSKHIKITLVFDCSDPNFFPQEEHPRKGITILYATPPDDADKRIIRLVKELKGNKRQKSTIIVVSSDRKHVARPAKKLGVQVLASEEFLLLLRKKTMGKESSEDEQKPTTVSHAEVEYYLEKFKEKG